MGRPNRAADFVTDTRVWGAPHRVQQSVDREANKGKRLEIWVTAVGQLRTLVQRSPLGPCQRIGSRRCGHGHLGGFPAGLVIKERRDIEVQANPSPPPRVSRLRRCYDTGMLGIDTRAARAAWTVFLVALTLVVIYYIRSVLLVFFLAILFAYVLQPVVSLVDRFIPWPKSRTYSLAVVYVVLLGVLVLAGMLIGGRVAEEGTNLAKSLPDLKAGLQRRLAEPGPAWLQPIQHYLSTEITGRLQDFGAIVLPLVQKAGEHALSLLSSVLFVVLVPILGFFFLKDGKDLMRSALDAVAADRRPMWEDIASDVHILLGQFIRALLILSLATFTAYSIFFGMIGLPYAVLLGTVAGALEFIPIFGPLIAAVAIVLVAGVSGAGHIVAIFVFLAAYRIFQDYILNPHLMSSGVELHPALVIFGALAGESLAGVPGMFLSIPAMATLRVIYVRVQKSRVAPKPTGPLPNHN